MLLRPDVWVRIDTPLTRAVERVAAGADTGRIAVAERRIGPGRRSDGAGARDDPDDQQHREPRGREDAHELSPRIGASTVPLEPSSDDSGLSNGSGRRLLRRSADRELAAH